jgi:hypothetical protein
VRPLGAVASKSQSGDALPPPGHYTLEALRRLGLEGALAGSAPAAQVGLEMPRPSLAELEAKREVLLEMQAVEAALAEAKARVADAALALAAAEAEERRVEEEQRLEVLRLQSAEEAAVEARLQAQREALESAVAAALTAPPPHGWQGALGAEIADAAALQELLAVEVALEAQQRRLTELRLKAGNL